MEYVRKKRLPSFEQLQRYGKKGAEVRREQLRPIRELAVKFAQAGSFPTRRKAAWGIAGLVVAYAASMGEKMSDCEAPTTITRWLKDAGLTFPQDR